jgi:NAD(P) transhydrogenase subunit alpha
MIIGVQTESWPGERRVALVPALVGPLVKAGAQVLVEAGAGAEAGFVDAEYQAKGAELSSRADVTARADILLRVRIGPSGHASTDADLAAFRPGQAVIAFLDPLSDHALVRALADRQVTAFSMELMPRITRAQSMDALSSMATISGYKAVLLAAVAAPRMFPMLMTAAGSVSAARAFVIGAGVAGLQAIATARRLGAVVQAYDVRAAAKEQIASLGAKVADVPIEAADAQDKGGYAKAQDESFYQRQREAMAKVVAASDVVITTAAIPGRRSPVLVTAEMVAGMQPGSVIVDLAAERGGNCALTRADETVVAHGVTILGPTNLPATVPHHASQMYAKNITTFLKHLLTTDGRLALDSSDEITRETLITSGGEVVHERVRGLAMAGA